MTAKTVVEVQTQLFEKQEELIAAQVELGAAIENLNPEEVNLTPDQEAALAYYSGAAGSATDLATGAARAALMAVKELLHKLG